MRERLKIQVGRPGKTPSVEATLAELASPVRGNGAGMRSGVVVGLCWLILVLLLAGAPRAEERHDETRGIQDNSFLLEEAYNQEQGVVQHITTWSVRPESREWVYSFTQEWPLLGPRHQIGFTAPLESSLLGPKRQSGMGDLALNYRFQCIGNASSTAAVAPRLTLILPTGNAVRGLGAGSRGLQVNLPLSVVLSRRWVAHWNAGATMFRAAKNDTGASASTTGYNLGASLVWLARPRANLLLEADWESSETVLGSDATERSATFTLSPGVRWSYDFDNGLQIVPGFAVPIEIAPDGRHFLVLLYLSFEHHFHR